MFDQVFKNHIGPKIADFYGVCCGYRHPSDSASQPVELKHVIVGDIRTVRVQEEFRTKIIQIRHFQMITDPCADKFCGLKTPVIHGQMVVGAEAWVIDEKPATDSDGFTKVKATRVRTQEKGNRKSRGATS